MPIPDVANLQALWDARNLLGEGVALPATGTAVSQWNDISGNARHLTQATSGRRPVFRASFAALGSRPAVEFDGTDDYLRAAGATFPTSAEVTVYVVYQKPNNTTYRTVVARPHANAAHADPYWRWAFVGWPSNSESFHRNGGAVVTSFTAASTARRVVCLRTQTAVFRLDGTQVADGTDGAVTYPTGATDVLVGGNAAGGEVFQGGIERIAVYGVTHDNATSAAVEAYLLSDAALTAGFAGSGALTASSNLAVARAAGVTGSGTLAASQRAGFERAPALTGTGTLTATSGTSVTRTATLTGAGTLTATTVARPIAAANMTGSGTLSAATAGVQTTTSATLAGTGVLTAATTAVVDYTPHTYVTVALGTDGTSSFTLGNNGASTLTLAFDGAVTLALAGNGASELALAGKGASSLALSTDGTSTLALAAKSATVAVQTTT